MIDINTGLKKLRIEGGVALVAKAKERGRVVRDKAR